MMLQVEFVLVHEFCTSIRAWTSGSMHISGKAAGLTPPMLRVRQSTRPKTNPLSEASMTASS